MSCFSKSLGFCSRRIPGFRQHLFRYGLCGALAVQIGLFCTVPSALAFPGARFTVALSSPVSESKELKGVEHDEILVDDFHTLAGGITFKDGKPVLLIPLVSYTTGKERLMAHEDGSLVSELLNPYIAPLADELGLKDYKDIQVSTATFLKNINTWLETGKLTDSEKRRIFYSLAYMHANMVEWKYADSSNSSRIPDPSFTSDVSKEGFSKSLAELKKLNDGSPEAERMVKEVELLMRPAQEVSSLRFHVQSENSSNKDFKRRMNEIDYPESVAAAAQYISDATAQFQNGEISRSDLVITLQIARNILTHQLEVQKGLPARGWYSNDHDASDIGANDIKDSSIFASQALLRSMGEAVVALGTEGSMQQIREVPSLTADLLVLAKTISADSYSLSEVSGMPAISQPFQAAELTTLVQTLVQNSETVLAKYPLERLALAPETPTQIAGLRRDFNDMFVTRYAPLQNASNMGERLSQLLQHIQNKQKGQWTQKDKEFFQALFQETIQSPSDEASRQFLATLLKDGLVVSEPKVVITPFSQTGKRLDFSLSPIAVEEGGVKRSTTLHPVDTLMATFTLQNRLHIPLHFQFAMALEQGIQDNPREVQSLELAPGTSQRITYTTHVSVVSREEDSSQVWVPKGEVILALNGLKMAVSASGFPQLAYR